MSERPDPRFDLSAPISGTAVSGAVAEDGSGYSVSGAGDVNGDGLDDFVIANAYSAEAYVVFGRGADIPPHLDLAALDGTDGFRIDGTGAAPLEGLTAAAAGDFNGDGIADLLIGAPGADGNGQRAGAAFVVYGRADGFAASLSLSALTAETGLVLTGAMAADKAGSAVAGLGDVNGDGIDDIAIGASTARLAGTSAGSAYVVFGSADPLPAVLSLSDLNGTNGFAARGTVAGDLTGAAVAGAGDLNGDGFGDILIGAPGADTGAPDSGTAYVLFGGAAFAANVTLRNLTGADGFEVVGSSGGDRLGSALAGAGDMNGDGLADILIGAPGASPGEPERGDAGAAYLVYGSLGPFARSLDAGALDETAGLAIAGPEADAMAGWAVAGAGDVNGDGISDLLIGAPFVAAEGETVGAAYLIFGAGDGGTPLTDLAAIDGTNGYVLTGFEAFAFTGAAVAGAGDVNGDGFADLLIGAHQMLPAGSSFLVLGGPGNLAALDGDGDGRIDLSPLGSQQIQLGAGGDDRLVGGNGDDLLYGFRGDDVLEGNRGRDTLIGNAGHDTLEGGEQNDYLLGRAGDDKLWGRGGDDTLLGDAGRDRLTGNVGRDYILGGADDDEINGNENADTLFGEAGADILHAGSGPDYADGGEGDDEILGDVGDDTLVGGTGGDTLHGGNGADLLEGGDGTDLLHGGSEADTLLGGGGADTLNGNGENDRLEGGGGADMLNGGAGEDVLLGGFGTDLLDGEADDDRLYGQAGADTLNGDAGNDTLEGGGGADNLMGDAGFDRLEGGFGADTLQGGNGNDTLSGHQGKDYLAGGAGADLFVFTGLYDLRPGPGGAGERASVDRIMDFDAAEGDLVDLTELLGVYEGSDPFADGFLRVRILEGATAVLEADLDGGGDGFVRFAQLETGTLTQDDILF